MTPYRRRAFSLMEVILMLPIIAAISSVGFQVTIRAMHMHAQHCRLMADDAVMRDLVRRMQLDAGQADEATIERDDEGVELRLISADRIVSYRVSADRVARREQADGEPALNYAWTLACARVDFQIESARSAPAIVWVSCTTIVPVDRGPVPERRLSAAVTVGRGGA